MRKFKAPLSSRDNAAILDALESGQALEDIVEPALVKPIQNWIKAVDWCERQRQRRLSGHSVVIESREASPPPCGKKGTLL